MGGTSCDVGLILNGVPAVSSELELEYAMPIHVPMVDVHTIGAGGGSVAFINDAGLLQVGPESAGATPGPICYGRGGQRPTITDANLVLGRLNPTALLAVENPVSLDTVCSIIERDIGQALGLNAYDAAAAILRIANDRMAGALRLVSLARGHDPRDFALFAFGGAGPLHAAALARELGVPQVLVPARPGITNALGCLVADLRHDFVNTVNTPVAELDMAQVQAILNAQVAEGKALIEAERVAVEETIILHSADMQFQGQSHLLSIALASSQVSREMLQSAFERAYWDRFEVELPAIRPVLVNLHTAVLGRRKSVDPRELLPADERVDSLAQAQLGTRPVWFQGGWHETPLYRREHLPLASQLQGPAIVEQLDTTIVVPPDCQMSIDELGNLLLRMG
ncbi:MAG: hydantoinase/oxoprolinase family protein, partial [Candidatus Competibacteraceae bacterium]|nr:hydantoinase/oxoprolinase family protein [Candidatus Competibacteraceae bacterium]